MTITKQTMAEMRASFLRRDISLEDDKGDKSN
jgi:hypothetical protein